jgi:hypothetical protein
MQFELNRWNQKYLIDCGKEISYLIHKHLAPYYCQKSAEIRHRYSIYLKEEAFNNRDLESARKVEFIKIIENKKDSRKNIEARKYSSEESVYFLIERTEGVICLTRKKIEIFCEDAQNLFKTFRIFLKDLSNSLLIRDGFVELHGSAIESAGLVSIFSSKSGGGKTSMLLKEVISNKKRMMSNGRVYIKSMDDRVHCIGTPESVYVRTDYTHKYKKLMERVAEKQIIDNKYKVEYTELSKMSIEFVPEGKLGMIYVPCLGKDTSNSSDDLVPKSSIDIFAFPDIERRFWHGLVNVDENEYNSTVEVMKEKLEKEYLKGTLLRRGEKYYVKG